jgi:hypothetical protein
MLKRVKQVKGPNYSAELPRMFIDESIEKDEDVQVPTKAQISLLMAELGRRGGKIGGKRRLETLSPAKRKEIARKAARTRWKNR